MKAKRSPETNAKMIATRRANQRLKELSKSNHRSSISDARPKDAVIYLKHARRAMTQDLRAGKIKEFDSAHLLALLALNSLTGG